MTIHSPFFNAEAQRRRGAEFYLSTDYRRFSQMVPLIHSFQ